MTIFLHLFELVIFEDNHRKWICIHSHKEVRSPELTDLYKLKTQR